MKYIVKGIFLVNKSEVDFLLLNKMFLLYLLKDVYYICSTTSRHKAKLHVNNVNFGVNKTFTKMLYNFHHMFWELKAPIVLTICCITFSFITVSIEGVFPVLWDVLFIYDLIQNL